MLEFRNVSFSFPGRRGAIEALHDVSFSCKEDEIVAVIGPSGCGKSTLLSLANGLRKPTGGHVLVSEQPVKGTDPRIGMMFQQTTLLPWRSVVEGKTIAVTSPGSLTANLARYFVMEAGLDPDKDVSLVSVGGGGEILGALKSSRADAAMLFEPIVTIAIQQDIATILVDVPESLDAFSSSALSTSKTFVEKSPKEAKAVFGALAEALKFIHSDKTGTLDIAKKTFANADTKVLEAALIRMDKSYSKDGKFTRGNIERTQAISVRLKIMPQVYPYEEVVANVAREAGK